MPVIAPFKAYYYNVKNRVKLENLLAPPHDIISAAERTSYLQKNHNNIVQIILPDSYPKAGQILNDWIKNKHLIQYYSPVFYIYETKYKYNSEHKKRYGLVALVKLSDFSKKQIIPHEKTFKKVTEDRLNLFRETNANFNPIFFIFNGTNAYTKIIQKNVSSSPFLSARDSDGVEHTLWIIDDTQDIISLQNYFKNISLIIADGHHRYISGLIYSSKNENKYIMGLLVDINDPGLLVFPTHRLVRYVPILTNTQIFTKIKKYFHLGIYDFNQFNLKENLEEILVHLTAKTRNTFGILLHNQSSFFIISLKDEFSPETLIQENYSNDLKRLDVSMLHEFIFNKLLEISQNINDSENIIYIKNLEDAFKNVQQGLYQALFILNPTKIDQILKITANSEIMPHKSTYFYPKPLSGLLIYKWK